MTSRLEETIQTNKEIKFAFEKLETRRCLNCIKKYGLYTLKLPFNPLKKILLPFALLEKDRLKQAYKKLEKQMCNECAW